MSEPAVMSADEAFRFVKEIMIRDFELTEDQIQLTSGLQDLGLDSIDRLDLLMTYGNMSGQMRQILVENVSRLSDPTERAQMALYLIAISPEYAVIQ